MTKKEFVILSILALLVLSALNVNTTWVSGVEYPAIYIEPASIVDTLTPGNNFTLSIYTDYNGTDIWSYEFTLTYNPNVIHGVEITNGDLITEAKHDSARFNPGTFKNTLGKLSLTVAYFLFTDRPVPLTYGPGTLANVTFTVVGKGTSNITFGSETVLKGVEEDGFGDRYDIIDAETDPTHIQHGYFAYRFQHDVAVVRVTADAEAAVGSLVSVGVEVANVGKFDEVVNVTILYDSAYIDSQNVTLLVGENKTASFSWDTIGLAHGNYTLNATATISGDGDLSDNWNTTIFLVAHDVRVVGITAPAKVSVESLVSISVDVANEGSFNEVVNVTILYDSVLIGFNDTVEVPAQGDVVVPFEWNTTGLAHGNYTLNATATISGDGDLSDNWNTTTIFLAEHDVVVISVIAPAKAAVGSLVSVGVEVANVGKFDEVVNVTILYDSAYIDSQNVTLLVGENKTASFSWDTIGLAHGNYTLNATATISGDGDLSDNWNTTTILLAMHDLAVTRISVLPTTIYVGDLATISVQVRNYGGFIETFEVEVTYDGSTIEELKTAMLPSGDTNYTRFSWNTAGVTPDSYTITAKVILATDQNPNNNVLTRSIVVNPLPLGAIAGTVTDASTGDPIVGTSVTANGNTATTNANGYYNITEVLVGVLNVTAEATGYSSDFELVTVESEETTFVNFTLQRTSALIHDVAVTEITLNPTTAEMGENVTITVIVENQGTENETFNVKVYYDATEIGTQEVTDLGPDVQKTLTFTWDTTGLDADDYTIEAVATTVLGETDTDDNILADVTVTVKEAPALDILLYVAAAGAAAIIIAAVAFYFLRIRKPKPT